VKPVMRDIIQQDKSVDPLKIDYIMEFILSAMIGVMGYWFAQASTISFEGLINLMYELFQHGSFDQIKQLQNEK
jgi:hypothetical protein